jgi:hypothetical protein
MSVLLQPAKHTLRLIIATVCCLFVLSGWREAGDDEMTLGEFLRKIAKPFAQARLKLSLEKFRLSTVTLESLGDSKFNTFPTRLYIQNGSRQG